MGGGRKTENNCTKISGNVDKMSHMGGEEEEKEKRFSRDLKIMSRDQEDKCVRACSLGPARSGARGAAAGYTLPPCGQMASLTFRSLFFSSFFT